MKSSTTSIASMLPKSDIANILGRWDLEAILLPKAVYVEREISYVPWIGLRGKLGMDLITIDIKRVNRTLEVVQLVTSRLDDVVAYKVLAVPRGYYVGLETRFHDTDSEIDPSRIEKIRVYSPDECLRIEFGLSRTITGLLFVRYLPQPDCKP